MIVEPVMETMETRNERPDQRGLRHHLGSGGENIGFLPERTPRSEGIEDLRAKPLGKKAPKVEMKVLIKED